MKNFLTQNFTGKKGLLVIGVAFLVIILGLVVLMHVNQARTESRLVSEVDAIIKDAGLEPVENYSTDGNSSCMDVCFSVKKTLEAEDDSSFDAIINRLELSGREIDSENSQNTNFYGVSADGCNGSIGVKERYNTYLISCSLDRAYWGL
ncbi:TPA: hypothetical protein EYO12_03765 [Candidatus Saccharibacteria bacterium]|nr:hypothetical protein [Candidatus Saccharibacteria bacterium]HIO87844.1 hypothetical protein [Candidatus Saccharibacteria bacterium]